MHQHRHLTAALAALVIPIAIYLSNHADDTLHIHSAIIATYSLDSLNFYQHITEIPPTDYLDPVDFEVIRAEKRPAVIRGLRSVHSWNALKAWNSRSYLIKNIPVIHNVRVANKPVFTYYDSSRSMSQILPEISKTLRNLSMDEFLLKISTSEPSNEYFYYSHLLSHPLGFQSLKKDLISESGDDWINLEAKQSSNVNVWIGSQGITAQAHYDPTDNVFVQLVGVKRFFISQISDWREYQIRPFNHPNYRQSQVDFSKAGTKTAIRALSATLYPGDVLYLPAYNFHRVEALSTSISVNAWFDSVETLLLKKMAKLGFPDCIIAKNGLKDHIKLGLLTKMFLMLSEKLVGQEKDFFNDLQRIRYGDLNLRKKLQWCDFDDFVQNGKSFCPKLDRFPTDLYNDELDRFSDKIKNSIGEQESMRKGLLEVVLGDYVEYMTELLIGVEKVCWFLQCVQYH